MKTTYQKNHPAHSSQKSAPTFVRAPRPNAAQLVLLRAAPARRLTQADVAEIRRAHASSTMQPQAGETVAALCRDLAEQFGVSVRTVLSIVHSGSRP